jgi:hypothetical protein
MREGGLLKYASVDTGNCETLHAINSNMPPSRRTDTTSDAEDFKAMIASKYPADPYRSYEGLQPTSRIAHRTDSITGINFFELLKPAVLPRFLK